MRELAVERALVAQVEGRGGECLKFTSPGRIGMPDRLILFPIPEEHREIVARYIRFAEVKAPGRKPRAIQEHYLARFREMGFVADVVSTPEEARRKSE